MVDTVFLARKDPNASLDMGFDWSSWLGTDSGGNAETISSSEWIASSTDITLSGEELTSTTTSVRVSGGTAGNTYNLTNRITTSIGQVDDRTIRITCQHT